MTAAPWRLGALAAALCLASAAPCIAQEAPTTDSAPPEPQPLGQAPSAPSFKPDAHADAAKPDPASPDVWIFSGTLGSSHESFSGTLVASAGKAQFELKLGGGATCDGSDVSGEIGLVRLSEIKCSDDRTMRALFVPQNGSELKVFGHVGDERFVTSAHLLGTDPIPEKAQTAEPRGPMGLPPTPPASETPPTAPGKPGP